MRRFLLALSVAGVALVSFSSLALAEDKMVSRGTVKSYADHALTITGSRGGGATFEQTFIIDSNTKVIGKGLGTAAAKRGGRLPAADVIVRGDMVSVSYGAMDGALRAMQVHVLNRATR